MVYLSNFSIMFNSMLDNLLQIYTTRFINVNPEHFVTANGNEIIGKAGRDTLL